MKKILQMIFKTEQEKEITVSLADPKADLSREEVAAVMQEMIEKSFLTSAKGKLLSIQDIVIKSADETKVA